MTTRYIKRRRALCCGRGAFAFISVRLTQMGTEVPVCVRIKKEGWWPSSSTSPGSFIAPLMRKEQALLYPSGKPKILSLC